MQQVTNEYIKFTVHITAHNLQCTLLHTVYSAHYCTQFTVHITAHNLQCTLLLTIYSAHYSTQFTVHITAHNLQCTLLLTICSAHYSKQFNKNSTINPLNTHKLTHLHTNSSVCVGIFLRLLWLLLCHSWWMSHMTQKERNSLQAKAHRNRSLRQRIQRYVSYSSVLLAGPVLSQCWGTSAKMNWWSPTYTYVWSKNVEIQQCMILHKTHKLH
jgi:hypothetical protein